MGAHEVPAPSNEDAVALRLRQEVAATTLLLNDLGISRL